MIASRINVTSGALLKALKSIAFANSPSASIPIIENVRMRWNEAYGELLLDTTDLNLSGSISLVVEATGEGSVCVSFPKLVNLLSALSEQPIVLTISGSNVKIKTDNGNYSLAGANTLDWPKAEVFSDDPVTISSSSLLSAIAQVLPFCSKDANRPAMSGVSLRITADTLTVVACSGHILARRVFQLSDDDWGGQKPKEPIICILSGRQAKAMTAIQDQSMFLQLYRNGAHLRVSGISTSGLTITGRLIDERYPNLDGLMRPANKTLHISRADLLHTLSRIGQVANHTTQLVRLGMAADTLTVSAEDSDFNNEGSERLLCEYTADNFEIGVNLGLLQTCLKSFNTPMIQINTLAANQPLQIRPSDLAPNDPNVSFTMPLVLQS